MPNLYADEPVIAKLAQPLSIGPVVIRNRVFLAPMSGISDRPFRDLAAAYGAGLVVSEMIAGEALSTGDQRARLRAERARRGPHVVQLAGRTPAAMAEGARAAEDCGADIIDINMGCPAKKVTGGFAGSALMRDLDHAPRLIAATVAATDRPVTLKMRLGWDDSTINAPELARRAEAEGVRLVTVHGRTRCQFYGGNADWAAIRAVKDAVTIPVVANGDLTDLADIGAMLVASGADGVMIGRGACGRPWLPGHAAVYAACGVAPPTPSGAGLFDLIATHYEAIIAHYGPLVGPRAARKHLGWYMDGLPPGAASPDARRAVLTASRPKAVLGMLAGIFAGDMAARAA